MNLNLENIINYDYEKMSLFFKDINDTQIFEFKEKYYEVYDSNKILKFIINNIINNYIYYKIDKEYKYIENNINDFKNDFNNNYLKYYQKHETNKNDRSYIIKNIEFISTKLNEKNDILYNIKENSELFKISEIKKIINDMGGIINDDNISYFNLYIYCLIFDKNYDIIKLLNIENENNNEEIYNNDNDILIKNIIYNKNNVNNYEKMFTDTILYDLINKDENSIKHKIISYDNKDFNKNEIISYNNKDFNKNEIIEYHNKYFNKNILYHNKYLEKIYYNEKNIEFIKYKKMIYLNLENGKYLIKKKLNNLLFNIYIKFFFKNIINFYNIINLKYEDNNKKFNINIKIYKEIQINKNLKKIYENNINEKLVEILKYNDKILFNNKIIKNNQNEINNIKNNITKNVILLRQNDKNFKINDNITNDEIFIKKINNIINDEEIINKIDKEICKKINNNYNERMKLLNENIILQEENENLKKEMNKLNQEMDKLNQEKKIRDENKIRDEKEKNNEENNEENDENIINIQTRLYQYVAIFCFFQQIVKPFLTN